VAIALIGNSKLVVLDEPTAGMDLSARRKLWNMLKKYKQGRIIILTTHYMDEADILGDRIGIMNEGELVCLGSPLFLKNRFGSGYTLTIVKSGGAIRESTEVEQYLKDNLGEEVTKTAEVSSEVTFMIPQFLSYKFTTFFDSFDRDLESIGVRSYGISVPTLENVFLQVTNEK
jgi:ATP-binding cassette subfamily A (ABC1) protein 3